MDDDSIALAYEPHQGFQLRAMGILAGCPVGERVVQRHSLQLPFRVLVMAADPYVSNALTNHFCPDTVRQKSMTLRDCCQPNPDGDLF